ncbi:hypothetical protein HKX48_008378 [Thoreauomyces humboldtii]|nr:hypothetical protein HKX48_008378 [Thoreauomyces humboldtii]
MTGSPTLPPDVFALVSCYTDAATASKIKVASRALDQCITNASLVRLKVQALIERHDGNGQERLDLKTVVGSVPSAEAMAIEAIEYWAAHDDSFDVHEKRNLEDLIHQALELRSTAILDLGRKLNPQIFCDLLKVQVRSLATLSQAGWLEGLKWAVDAFDIDTCVEIPEKMRERVNPERGLPEVETLMDAALLGSWPDVAIYLHGACSCDPESEDVCAAQWGDPYPYIVIRNPRSNGDAVTPDWEARTIRLLDLAAKSFPIEPWLDYLMDRAVCDGSVKLLQYLYDRGAEVSADDDYELIHRALLSVDCWGSELSQDVTLSLLTVMQGTEDELTEARRKAQVDAIAHGHVRVLKYLAPFVSHFLLDSSADIGQLAISARLHIPVLKYLADDLNIDLTPHLESILCEFNREQHSNPPIPGTPFDEANLLAYVHEKYGYDLTRNKNQLLLVVGHGLHVDAAVPYFEYLKRNGVDMHYKNDHALLMAETFERTKLVRWLKGEDVSDMPPDPETWAPFPERDVYRDLLPPPEI